MTFLVGDRVRIAANSNNRTYSVVGSTGVILGYHDRSDNVTDVVRVAFDYFAGRQPPNDHIFRIPVCDIVFDGPRKDPILQVIDRLHKRQHFYKTHRHELPSWNVTI